MPHTRLCIPSGGRYGYSLPWLVRRFSKPFPFIAGRDQKGEKGYVLSFKAVVWEVLHWFCQAQKLEDVSWYRREKWSTVTTPKWLSFSWGDTCNASALSPRIRKSRSVWQSQQLKEERMEAPWELWQWDREGVVPSMACLKLFTHPVESFSFSKFLSCYRLLPLFPLLEILASFFSHLCFFTLSRPEVYLVW